MAENELLARDNSASVDLGRRRLGKIRALNEMIAQLQGLQLREIAAFHTEQTGTDTAAADDEKADAVGGEATTGMVASELGLLLAVGEHHARRQVTLACDLVGRLPHTLAAMETGALDVYKASKVAEVTAMLSVEHAREVDARLAGRLEGKTPGQLRRTTRRLVCQVDPDGAAARAQAREKTRRLSLVHGEDAMAELRLELPAHAASACYARIDRMARSLRRLGDERTLEQLRADVAADLLLGTEHGHAGVRTEVHVYVDLATLAGVTDNPGELAGHGPIPAAVARQIAHQPGSVWRRLVTEPLTGTPIDVGRARYRPPAVTDEFVRVRDRVCRHPGCHRPAHFGDPDHRQAWAAGGETNHADLLGYCRYHHRLRHKPGWTYDLDAGTGVLTITTPSGMVYRSDPEPLHEPRPPTPNGRNAGPGDRSGAECSEPPPS